MSLTFQPMMESRPIREIAYEVLKKAIITGEIPAGERIVETDYADRLHISRTPLREALRKLERDGLVEYVLHRGVVVRAFTINDIEEIFTINYYAKFEKMVLNHHPDNYKYDGKKLYYLPFEFREYKGQDTFASEGIKYWFYTKELVDYLKEKGLPYDEKRIGNEYQRNKEMALMAVKYYS